MGARNFQNRLALIECKLECGSSSFMTIKLAIQFEVVVVLSSSKEDFDIQIMVDTGI